MACQLGQQVVIDAVLQALDRQLLGQPTPMPVTDNPGHGQTPAPNQR